jgi:hypothetical protein
VAREERDRGKRVKIRYRKLQINGEWFRWDERERGETEEKFKKERRREDEPAKKDTKRRSIKR